MKPTNPGNSARLVFEESDSTKKRNSVTFWWTSMRIVSPMTRFIRTSAKSVPKKKFQAISDSVFQLTCFLIVLFRIACITDRIKNADNAMKPTF